MAVTMEVLLALSQLDWRNWTGWRKTGSYKVLVGASVTELSTSVVKAARSCSITKV